jgi:hypothetical protein
MNSALSTFRQVLISVALATIFCAGCNNGEDCNTVKSYYGTRLASDGTVTYGQPPISQPFVGAVPDPSSYPCMQAPATCTSVSFGCKGGGPINIDVTVAPFQNGQVVTLPSPDVTVTASLDDSAAGIPDDGGSNEDLTLISGSLNVTVTLNNFDGYFNMTFARPNGDSVVIQNGRAALLNASWTETTICN